MTAKTLNIQPNIASPDDFYERLIELHRGLSNEQSQAVNASLILLLANHIGDEAVLADAMRRARAQVDTEPGTGTVPAASPTAAWPH